MNEEQKIYTEQCVLGGAIIEPACAQIAVDALSAEMFSEGLDRDVFSVMTDLYWSGRPIDPVTLVQKLPDYKVGITQLAQLVPSLAHYEEYVRILQKQWLDLEINRELSKMSVSGESADELIPRMQELIAKHQSLVQALNDKDLATFAEAVQEFLEWLNEREEEPPRSGFPELDRATGGFLPGSVFVIAARPGGGKTDYALNLALRLGKQKSKVLYFSMEMTNIQIMQRVASNLLKISGERVRDRTLTEEERGDVERTMEAFSRRNLIDFVQLPHVGIKHVRHYVDLEKPDVVIVDHIGLMQRPNIKDQYRALGMISNHLKQLALEKGISIIELVQMNRQIENRGNKIPTLADLRESGDIEQDADFVGFLTHEDSQQPLRGADESMEVILHLQKNRHGKQGRFRYRWQPQYHGFSEVETRYG